MSSTPAAEAHAEDAAPAVLADSPKVLVDLCDHANAPSVHRQSPGAAHDVGAEATTVQRTPPSLLEKAAVARSLKGKEKEWTAVAEKKRPLQLLDLPVDILKEIIEKLPHTNDLTSLSLCHSVFHALTIPHIYSRFDIVWPDDTSTTVQRTGVDALTYGLATLVMAEENFGEAPWQRAAQQNPDREANLDPYPIPKRRRGNYYAKYTKKFSLGNGPKEWVQEYLISKEGGKMLGTLVALAVSRMRNLETFVWDMPTGVLRDVWLALSSLADRGDGQECRLEKVWIRWHDNASLDGGDSALGPIPPPPPINNNAPPPPAVSSVPVLAAINMTGHSSLSGLQAIDRVEHPTFSVLPALKSLNVMDIDELAYLDEMAILIARSQNKLRELRVGIAPQAQQRDWVAVWDGETLQQVDHSAVRPIESRLGEKRLGGVLGILLGRVYNLRNNADTQRHSPTSSRSLRGSVDNKMNGSFQSAATTTQMMQSTPSAELTAHGSPSAEPSPGVQSSSASTVEPHEQAETPVADSVESPNGVQQTETNATPTGPWITGRPIPLRSSRRHGPYLSGKLRLDTLELERVPLSIQILQKALDWTMITKLTLLHCQSHEQLWRMLRRNYSPSSPYNSAQQSKGASGKVRLEYGLNLKQIHTNTVSPSLITFLKETLAPNSLQVLFLQEARSYNSSVTIDQIYRGPIRRHKSSLQKLMIDSSEKGDDAFGSTRWRRWMLNTEIVTYLTSGRMEALRELGVALDYRDWHHFLQRLPNIAHLRSLYIPHIADHPHGANIDPRDLALQVVDIVTLRPEIELCYMGIGSKCFEILENRPTSTLPSDAQPGSDGFPPGDAPGGGYAQLADGDVTDEEELEDGGDIDDDEDAGDDAVGGVVGDSDEDGDGDGWDDGDDEDDDEFDTEMVGSKRVRLRLREILFYDDKVAVFKARHGRL
ncbi:uncharacterized protein PV09_08098 [Verruconis gallopava]|uniref:F-box domain-containing protein n=1 Tax=Verruconis gallopava TaxID=253628 RepID=A0A0D2AMN1_9PEZI|nr:uncharacterized protein PV09_08098 [Verruconis gallopava]KIW00389.1 hypothetical protein PV09_08098 [Verruconis gallopava]